MKYIQHFKELVQKSNQERQIELKNGSRDGTVIIEGLPEFSYDQISRFHTMLIHGHYLTLQVGVSVVHPRDRFCRKTGLELARSNLKSVQFRVNTITNINGNLEIPGLIKVVLVAKNGYRGMSLLYDATKKYPKVLIGYGITPAGVQETNHRSMKNENS